jgi:hypothetical protein
MFDGTFDIGRTARSQLTPSAGVTLNREFLSQKTRSRLLFQPR